MKKIWFGFAALLFGGNLVYGYDATYLFGAPAPPVNQAVAPAESFTVPSEESNGLTPKRPTSAPVVQHVPVPVPLPVYSVPVDPPVAVAEVPEVPVLTVALRTEMPMDLQAPAGGGVDPYVFAELERLNSEILKLRKDTAKPDTKKAWSAPKISGRIFIDSVNFVDQNKESWAKNGDMGNAAGFRDLRLGASGSGYDSFDYKVEFGFYPTGGNVALTDNWAGVKNVPLLGYVRVGHFRPETGQYYPMGPTNVSSMEYITPSNVFGLGRRIGISSENLFAKDRIRLFFGVFQSAGTDMKRYLVEDNQGQVVNIRITAAPWFEQEGKYLFHVGGHWEYVSLDSNAQNSTAHSAKPGTFSWAGDTLLSGNFDNEYSHRGGLELAYQHGRFSARSELFTGSFSAYGQEPGRHLHGAYLELGYFLTDDFRTYDLKSGAFSAVKMKRNFHPYKHGEWNLIDSFGAWQAVFQWGYTDMEDWRRAEGSNQYGGHQNDFIAGLNWFWSPQMRWMFQYVRSNQCVGTTYSHRSQDIFGTSIRYNW